MKIIIYLLILLSVSLCQKQPIALCTQLNFLPMPRQISCNIKDLTPKEVKNPCNILFVLKLQTN